MAQHQQEPIYEPRDEKLISPQDGEPTVRIGRFLKPLAKNLSQAISIPNTPLLSEIFPHNLQQWPTKIVFKGWNCPQKKWKEWVDKLSPKYSSIWTKTGICDAILSSIYEVRCNQELVLGLSEFWCADTNTFVFPWGEATITLEDVKILGGYPVFGDPVNSSTSPPDELVKLEEEMIKQRALISRSRARKPGHSGWIKHFMETETEFEHVGFLSLWLSRYVFPSFAEETMGKHVFSIAAKLSLGVQVGLAQAVLASLYKDLGILREKAVDSKEPIGVTGPLQLLQIWACERFQLVGPKSPDSVEPGEPRVARWHKLNWKLNLPLVRSALKLGENFQWRPYAVNLKNWQHPSYYRENEQLVIDWVTLDDQELQSFLLFLQCCELVGIDCKEKYRPHRVAMQFGYDQDLPSDFTTFEKGKFAKNFVPARLFRPGVSMRYSDWWKDMMVAREGAIKEVLLQKRDPKNNEAPSQVQANVHEEKGDKSPQHPTKLSQASTKPEKPNGSVASKTTKSPKKSCGVASKKPNGEESHKSSLPTTLNKNLYEDSSDDYRIPISTRMQSTPLPTLSKYLYEDSSDDYHIPVSTGMKSTPLPTSNKNLDEDSSDDYCILISTRMKSTPVPTFNKNLYEDSSDDYRIPISTRMKSTPLPTLNKNLYEDSSDDYHVPLSIRRKNTPLRTSNKNLDEVSSDDDHIPIGRRVKKARYDDDSSDDNVPIARHKGKPCKGSNNVASSTWSFVSGSEKGRPSASKEEILTKEVTTESVGFAREVKRETVEGFNFCKGKKESNEKKGKTAGETVNNPIEIDDCERDCRSGFEEHGQDIEGRIRKLEKMLGVVQD